MLSLLNSYGGRSATCFVRLAMVSRRYDARDLEENFTLSFFYLSAQSAYRCIKIERNSSGGSWTT